MWRWWLFLWKAWFLIHESMAYKCSHQGNHLGSLYSCGPQKAGNICDRCWTLCKPLSLSSVMAGHGMWKFEAFGFITEPWDAIAFEPVGGYDEVVKGSNLACLGGGHSKVSGTCLCVDGVELPQDWCVTILFYSCWTYIFHLCLLLTCCYLAFLQNTCLKQGKHM